MNIISFKPRDNPMKCFYYSVLMARNLRSSNLPEVTWLGNEPVYNPTSSDPRAIVTNYNIFCPAFPLLWKGITEGKHSPRGTSKSSEHGELLYHRPRVALALTWQLSCSGWSYVCVSEHEHPEDISPVLRGHFQRWVKGRLFMLVSNELPILERKNKGYLINTADL